MLEKNQNIIIIGAGPAGLSLSATLKMCSISHIVLEKASNSGGQIFYINNPLEDLIIDDLNTGKDLIFKFENFTKKYNLPVQYENEILKIDKDAKVIVSSGYSNDPLMSNYKKYGFKAVITKPYVVDLARIVNSVIKA